jgi:perosamine synthetase
MTAGNRGKTMEIRNIPWYGLGAIYEQDDIDAVTEILKSCVTEAGGFFRLPQEPDFQKAYAAHEDSKYASAVNSCGTGLDIALQILGIGPGDEVITTPHTFVCTGTCILLKGAVPVFADIDPVTHCLDPARAEEKITDRTKAIIPVHFGGMPCDVESFKKLSEKYGVKIVYDAAHAAGSSYKGRRLGGHGDMSVYSFQSNKNMSTLGEGGAITTNNAEYFERAERIKSFGFRYGPVDDVVELGTNLRMSKLQSAVGLTQLAKLDRNNMARRSGAGYLTGKIKGTKGIVTPAEPENCISSWHLYALLYEGPKETGRDGYIKILRDKYRIGVTVHYRPLYEWKVFKDRGYSGKDTPIAARIAAQLFNVPLFARMGREDLDYIAWAADDCMRYL